MAKYAVLEDYDSSYKVKNREIACYSKDKMKELFPDGNFPVTGETLLRNKKKEINTIELGGRSFSVSKEDSHSSLLTRTKGYVSDGKGGYIVLLRPNFLLLWILFGVLAAAGAVLALFLLLPKDNNGILPPDFSVPDDPNAVVEPAPDEPVDHIIIHIPSGEVESDIKSDIGFRPKDIGKVEILLTVDGKDYTILSDAITMGEDGTFPDMKIDFTKVHVELKPGRYLGWVIFTAPNGAEVKLPILIVIRNTYGGSMTIGYSDKVLVDRATGGITMRYDHGADASHDCILQLILDNGGREYLLAQSGALHPGQSLSTMTLDGDAASRLTSGVYHGRLRINLYNGESKLTDMNTDIEVTITVQ